MSGTRLVLAAAPDHVIPIFGNRTPSCEDVLIGNRSFPRVSESRVEHLQLFAKRLAEDEILRTDINHCLKGGLAEMPAQKFGSS
jgi:hypothetical protein